MVGAKIFIKIDLKDAYYRICLREGDEWKTVFRTRYSYFEYIVIPFGLINAPITFQSYIYNALSELLNITYIIYLNDILIFSKDRDSYIKVIKEVLEYL